MAFLSAPPPPVIKGTRDFMGMYMFLKPANSDTENGAKKIKKVPRKKSCTAETDKLEKTLFEMYQNNTVIGWLPNLKKKNNVYTVFDLKTAS